LSNMSRQVGQVVRSVVVDVAMAMVPQVSCIADAVCAKHVLVR